MPTYRNTAGTPKFFPAYGMVPAGASVVSGKYPYPLDQAFELVSYGEAPWVKLHADPLPAALTGLARYGQILIVNNSGESISVTANEDSPSTLVILDGHTYPIIQDREIEKLEITGTGAGVLYVYGLRF